MMEFLHKLSDLSMVAFVVSSMLAIGMSQRLADVVAPLRDPKPVFLALFVNFAVSPLLAFGLSRLIPLQPPHAIGLMLLGGAAGAPFLPKLAEAADGDVSYSVALMALLMAASVVFVPLALPLLVPGLKADPLEMAKPLLVLMVLPLVSGYVLNVAASFWAGRLLKVARRISSASFFLLLALLVGLNLPAMAAMIGSFAIGTYALFVLGVAGAGHLCGGKDKSKRDVFVLAASQRNIAAALIVAKASFDDPAIEVMLVVASVVGVLVLLALAGIMRRRASAGRASP